MQQTCAQCSAPFEITDDDLQFYDKVSPVIGGKKFPVPAPTLCPSCRAQRRQAHFNYEFLYRRPSSKTGKQIVSSISADKPYTVFEQEEWWKDDWDPMGFGKEFAPDTSVFSQMEALQRVVPMMSLVTDGNENSEYVQYSGWDKNCYLCFCTDYSEDCMYTHSIYYAKNTLDCFMGDKLELCYECVYCNECHRVSYSQNCQSCNDSWFLFDCQNCSDCFGCVGLRQKQYCFFNEELSKKDYEERCKEYPTDDHATKAKVEAKMTPLRKAHPCRATIGLQNEDCTGDYLFHCKHCKECFDCNELEDSKHCNSMRGGSDCYDISHWGHPAELCLECGGVGENANRLLFCMCCWPNCSDLLYCSFCISCRDCFGCVGLRKKQYCIFNTQYDKETYETLVTQIIGSMTKQDEWGEYFPVTISPYAYNESVSQKYYPLSKEEIVERGWSWKDPEDAIPQVTKTIEGNMLPESIGDIPDDVLDWAIRCEVTSRPFKILKQELQFYRDIGLPVPRIHPDERLLRRVAKRNPRKVLERTCAKCKKDIQTTYAPEKPETVYCETCYLNEVY